MLLKVIFKVTDIGTNQTPVCDFLLVINTSLTDYYLLPFRSYRILFCTKNGHFAF